MTKQIGFKISLGEKELNCFYLTEPATAERYIQKLLEKSTPCIGCDLETGKKKGFENDPVSGLCPYRSFISLAQFYDGLDTVYLFDTKLLPVKILQPIFTEKRVVAHNSIFDQQHLMLAGLTNLKFDCSMIAYNIVRCAEYASLEEEEQELENDYAEGEGQACDWLNKGERHGASLRTVTAKLLNIRVEKEHQTSNWSDRPLSKDQLLYGAGDSYFTFEVGRILSNKIIDLGLSRVYSLNRSALTPVCQMILNGCAIDAEKHAKDCKKWATRKDQLQVQLLKILGNNANLRSIPQVSRWLEKTLPIKYQHKWPRSEKTGYLKTDARTLTLYSHLDFVAPMLEFKKLEKLLNTYGLTLLERINPVTRRLHGSFTLGYTSTGRLSSRSPNLQNLPRETDIRGIFRASYGNELLGADYGQIELRVAAELSKDRVMLQAYKTGEDLHALTASKITGKRIDKVSKEDRQLAKSLNFGLLFGLGAKGLVDYANWNYGVKLELSTAYEYYKTFFDTYSGYESWQKEKRAECERFGTTSTRLGKLRRLQRNKGYTRSVNHPVQGSAAEVVITALSNIYGQLKHGRAKIINLVHDEILVECPRDEVPLVSQVIKEGMEAAMLKLFPKASLNKLVEVKQGLTWADTK